MNKYQDTAKLLAELGLSELNLGVSTGTEWTDTEGAITSSFSPIDGKEIAKVKNATLGDYERVVKKAQEAFKEWRLVPAPIRGEIVR